MAIEKETVTKERFEEAYIDCADDIWTGYNSVGASIGFIVTDEGQIAQVQLVMTTDKDEWLGDEEPPEVDF